ncbi:DUF1232 domain-containing protein [Paenibacillus hodogayensis]|uniref:DUF1232 domain-containing protein n=1 Tax=Paenibacillus hodogayensis TaxID=279208 RepID=A0ABV5W4D8_9BACL
MANDLNDPNDFNDSNGRVGGNGERLGELLKTLLQERSLSMRKLGGLTGIDVATISRIAAGKQAAKAGQLQKIADNLNVPVGLLLEASGLKLNGPDAPSDLQRSVDSIQETLAGSDWFDVRYTTVQVERELANYERYARTEEGRRLIHDGFAAKMQQVDGMGPFIEHLQTMYETFSKTGTSEDERALLGSALLYFILSTDIIPDYLFPIGYLDDAIAVHLTLRRLAQMSGSETDT